MRKLLKGISVVVVLLVLLYSYLVWMNNNPVTTPGQAALEATLENSIQWLENNRDDILSQDNPMLWHMVQQAADVSGDQRLQQLFSGYEQRYLKRNRYNPWRPLFYPGTRVHVQFSDIASHPYYNWHLIYAIACNSELAQVAEIVAQNDPAFCDEHPLSPVCVTHQLMGIRLMQRIECGEPDELDSTVEQLQQRIYRQLLLDVRVVDVYMQRVLMLEESGAGDLVKSAWIENLVEAQQADGSWSGFDPLIPLGSGWYFGYGRDFFTIKQPNPSFHMTAQGVLLFTLLTHPQQ